LEAFQTQDSINGILDMINLCKTQLFQLKLHRMKWIRPTPRDQGFLKKKHQNMLPWICISLDLLREKIHLTKTSTTILIK